MFLGLDIGTSAVKAVLVGDGGAPCAEASMQLEVSRPRPSWSEQDPKAWWAASCAAVRSLPADLRARVRAVGLSGQMHGAVLLGADRRPLRPAILWNDSRAVAECAALEQAEPASRAITGNAAMPGFTAPKLLWVRRHEPEVFRQTALVLLPKDYVRLCLTGEAATDLSDASGTLWLECRARRWSELMLDTCGLTRAQMPRLYEGNEVSGTVKPEAAAVLGIPAVPVAAGGGDNAAGAVGIGAVEKGDAMLSLGTSGVLFVANDLFSPAPEGGAHAFCHALPGRWHQMAVILSAASCLDWAARLTGSAEIASTLTGVADVPPFSRSELFLPYLSGERTPHNDPHARGVLFGMNLDTNPTALVAAVMEGVAFAFADGLAVLRAAGAEVVRASVIGGGARSAQWGRLLAAALDLRLVYRDESTIGPAFGAARLARLAVTGESVAAVCTPPPVSDEILPEPGLVELARAKHRRFAALYPALKEHFA
jgi:xylulokinase